MLFDCLLAWFCFAWLLRFLDHWIFLLFACSLIACLLSVFWFICLLCFIWFVLVVYLFVYLTGWLIVSVLVYFCFSFLWACLSPILIMRFISAEVWSGGPLWGTSGPAIRTKTLINALAASANLWRGLADVAGTRVISWPLFSSGLTSCLDHSNVVDMWRNWISTGIGVLDNTSKVLIFPRFSQRPLTSNQTSS